MTQNVIRSLLKDRSAEGQDFDLCWCAWGGERAWSFLVLLISEFLVVSLERKLL